MRRVKEAIARPETEIPQRKIAWQYFPVDCCFQESDLGTRVIRRMKFLSAKSTCHRENFRGKLHARERIYFEWDKALSHNDANALLELYAPDAVIESPLIPHLLGKKEGVCRGREEMRPFLKR